MTLDDNSVAPKIGARFLTALEEEQFDQLPGGIFNKGFVKAYARHLGINEDQAVADYVAASQTTLPETSPEESPELAVMASRVPEIDASPVTGLPWGLFAIALLLVAFGLAIWGFYLWGESARPA